MGKILDIEGPFIQFLNRVADLMILNILVMLLCIPIITAGAAFTAMHYVLLKMARKEEGYLIKGFFKSFRQNFKQATLIWLGMLVLIAFFAVDFWIFKYTQMEFSKIFITLFLAVAVVAIMTAVYVFPILARFNNSTKYIIRNAFSLAILNVPRTILMIIFYVSPLVIAYFSTFSWVFVFIFGISLPAYLSAFVYSGIFKKFEPDESAVTSDYDFSVNVDEGNEEDR